MLHGLNWYLALIHATLGVQLPLLPDYNDHNGPWNGTVDFWRGMDDGAWECESYRLCSAFTRPAVSVSATQGGTLCASAPVPDTALNLPQTSRTQAILGNFRRASPRTSHRSSTSKHA
jgi:hypothetical protein